MNFLFIIFSTIHIFVWVFVLFAFLNKKSAYFNLNYFIPFIYILHIFPFHVLTKLKQQIYEPIELEEKGKTLDSLFIFPRVFKNIQTKLNTYCTFSPISPQGMLIFGLISSYYSIKNK